jgi:hypothetical protein
MDSLKNIPLNSSSSDNPEQAGTRPFLKNLFNNIPNDFPSADETCLKKPKSICKSKLVNKLNFINFSDRTILVNFKHTKYATTLSLQAKPLPCAGERLECVWTVTPDSGTFRAHTFLNLFISDGHKCFLVNAEQVTIDEHGISMLLPEACQEIRSRNMNRHSCQGIQVQFSQNSAMYSGTLVDVSPISLGTHVTTPSRQSFQWLNFALPVNLQLHSNQKLLYSGECTIVRKNCDQSTGVFVLTPVNSCFQRFKPKKFRSSRLRLTPSPNMVFIHPLTGKTINLKIIDLSGSGFSVEENASDSTLFAGLIIPELELQFSHRFRITCQAQVVYRTSSTGDDKDTVTCGMTILDMDMNDQVSLLSLLQQTENRNSYIDTAVDMDALWSFFFETGFIYPSKYAFFQSNKVEIKKTYERLYNHNPSIARHFIFQKKGNILGHMAMVRFYNSAWLIHHHAASKAESMRAGIEVLKQIGNYINEVHNLNSAHLKYVYCYFRPENKFPNRIFGGFAKQLNDQQGSSLDTFAYFHYRKTVQSNTSIPDTWALTEIRPEDYAELKRFYSFTSGGLMMDAFGLHTATTMPDDLAQEYQRLGFKKERRLYSLQEAGELKAIFIADMTDIGFNMANLTNCITVIILDEMTPRFFVESALACLAEEYEHQEMPVLVYPAAYTEKHSLPVEKFYTLWVLNMQYTDHYFQFTDSFFPSSQKPLAADIEEVGTSACHA